MTPSSQPGSTAADSAGAPAAADIASRRPAVVPLALRPAAAPPLRRRAVTAAARRAAARRTWPRPTQALRARGDNVGDALRILRQLVMERLITLDCDEQAPLAVVTTRGDRTGRVRAGHRLPRGLRELDARTARRSAADGQRAAAVGRRHGQARRARAQRLQRHRPDLPLRPGRRNRRRRRRAGAASPTTSTSHKAVKLIYGLIGDTTEHGFVFRVDLALRPNGNSGPPRRFAGRPGRLLPGAGPRVGALRLAQEPGGRARAAASTSGSAQALRGAVLPFVFRRYLDYSVFDSLRVLHQQIREQAAQAAAPAGPSAPTTSSSRAAASARSSSRCSCCRWCAAASSPNCARARRCRRCSAWPRPA